MNESLRVAEVVEVRGTRIKAKVFSDKNDFHVFNDGSLVRNVSVGGYVRIPCGFSDVIGVIEGEIQTENIGKDGLQERRQLQVPFSRFIEIAVFGVVRAGRFDRGVTILPLVGSAVYIMEQEQLSLVTAMAACGQDDFVVGRMAGQDGIMVAVPASGLFASHIGVFGNTGSGKSNTLCRIYTDCLSRIESCIGLGKCKSRFFVIDFNGEYVGPDVLTQDKQVYSLSTHDTKGDKIPVPKSFYEDVDIWAILTQATEKTQKPFLKKVIRTLHKVQNAEDPAAYLKKMVQHLLEGYCGKEYFFQEQREDLMHLLSFVIDKDNATDVREKIEECFEKIEPFARDGKVCLWNGADFGDSPEKIYRVFNSYFVLEAEEGQIDKLVKDIPSCLEFLANFVFLQQWRSGNVVREHIACWIPRLSTQLKEAKRIYETTSTPLLDASGKAVSVISLLDVNQEQKKLVPLIVAKYIYQSQKERGQKDSESSVHLIIDEAHNILSYSSQRESESWRDYRLETFEEIVKEGRKFGMYLTISSQRPSDISSTIVSQMHNYFIHRLVNDDDLHAISKAVSFIDSANASMIPVLPQGTCILSGVSISYPTRVAIERLPLEKQPRSYDRDLAAAWGFSLNSEEDDE